MSAITYETASPHGVFLIRVLLDGKCVGMIRANATGFYYVPKHGGEPGETFATVAEVKRSLVA